MKHPARYSAAIMPELVTALALVVGEGASVLDPFAGTGKIHDLRPTYETTGVELEPEWAALHPRTVVGSALALPFADASFDAICTSPTYGNRMADHHEAKDASRRMTYRHTLGRPLHPENSGAMQWGPGYRAFHEAAWTEAVRVLRPGGVFVLNISDHIRRGEVVPVSEWHSSTLEALGLTRVRVYLVPTPRMKFGANAAARVSHESVYALRKVTS